MITKDQLFGAVWPEVNVGDAALVTCIQELRRALKDDARRPRYIETLHRRGYRFVGKTAVAPPDAAVDGNARALPLPDRPSIAVLPFANMSEDPDQEHFADGISEDLITDLSRIHWLFVIARNSTFVYKNRAVDVKQVARELGVRYVLEGSVRRAGKRIRISAQLIDAVTGGHHWAERYDRELGDIFAVQDEITRSVVAAIEPRLLAAEGIRTLSRSSDDLGAWERVARAQTHVWRLTRADYADGDRRARTGRRDLSGLRAGAQPAGVLPGVCGAYGLDRSRVRLLAGRQHAIRAVALDDCDSWGQIALGYLAMMERRTEESIAAFRRAVELNPNSAKAHGDLGRGAGVCRARPRGDRAGGRRHQAQPAGSGHGAVSRRDRGRALWRRAIRGRSAAYRRSCCGCARGFRARNGCAVRAWPRPGASTKRGRFLPRYGASSRSFRSIGSGQACPTRRRN